jgi:hypothetical protein
MAANRRFAFAGDCNRCAVSMRLLNSLAGMMARSSWPRLGFWVDGYWFGMPILRTIGVWAGIWAATTVGRHPDASRWEILSWTAVAAIAGVIAGFVIVMLVGPWVGWTGP